MLRIVEEQEQVPGNPSPPVDAGPEHAIDLSTSPVYLVGPAGKVKQLLDAVRLTKETAAPPA